MPRSKILTEEQVRRNQNNATRRYRQKQAKKGLSQVTAWVPTSDVERLKKYAAKLKKKHLETQND